MTCPAAETLARLARAHGWTAEVRYSVGKLDYIHQGDPKPDGGHWNVQVAEPIHCAGVYCRRGSLRVSVWYASRDSRPTPAGNPSWSLHSAVGRRHIADGYTPTAFEQEFEEVVTVVKGKRKKTKKPLTPTTKVQVEAYLVEHGGPVLELAAGEAA